MPNILYIDIYIYICIYICTRFYYFVEIDKLITIVDNEFSVDMAALL